ncbi:ATP-NAD kinase family protein [Paraclostridium bifermentans]|uniref:ATP-NAD kinase family protein n=1 Tax=Paraclostridium bifermentans TaxID=1490 RepID=UPI001FF485C1|nr:ATP-NAD kinase family protein [Paraclostridium bifermentans]UOW66635.1 ATP-NAD kinase family protein [Paraclostridium bifermentans]
MINIGLIVNPIAGMGGSVGLKGTDGEDILKEAISLGSKPKSPTKAIKALKELESIKDNIKVITGPKDMGENEAKVLNFNVEVINIENENSTSSKDTIKLAKDMLGKEISILIFVGGDGTARDIYKAVEDKVITIGIPAGVKIHSPVYAINPKSGGKLALQFLNKKISTIEREVLDLDEEMYRKGKVNTKLYGYLKVPREKSFMQNKKAPTPLSEESSQKSIGLFIADNMEKDIIYIIGPGTTTRAILDTLNLKSTLLGIDIIKNKKIIKNDANEKDILECIKDNKAKLIITPTGGQGYLLGRGNQQISDRVIKSIGRENIIVVSTLHKLQNLKFKPLYIDTSNEEVDNMLNGYMRIVVGYKEEIMYSVRS